MKNEYEVVDNFNLVGRGRFAGLVLDALDIKKQVITSVDKCRQAKLTSKREKGSAKSK